MPTATRADSERSSRSTDIASTIDERRPHGTAHPRRGRLFGIASLVMLAFVGSAQAQTTSIAFVQSNWTAPPSATTLSAAYLSLQTTGNVNVVIVGWNDVTRTVQSVTDTKGNTYVRAVGPTVLTGKLTQSIYYARNIAAAAAGANTVTVVFSGVAIYPDVRVAEYGGLDPVNPLDGAVGATGTSGVSDSGALTTTNANDLLVAGNMVSAHTTAAGTGYTSRVITSPDGDILEDRIVTAVGSYNATAPLSGGSWVMQLVAFRAAGGSGNPTRPDLTLTKQHSGAFTQGQTGATYTLAVTNPGTATTSGTVTVVDALPGGLTATALSGIGWTCTLSSVTCTRADALGAGASYPAITLTVNVLSTAPSSVTNAATVTGGGEANTANNSASDVTPIGTTSPPPPPPPPPGPVAFPVRYSANRHYLVDQNSSPFPILGRTAWFVIAVPVADYQMFINDTVSRGYNSIEMHVLDHDYRGYHPPLNGNNDAPFLKRLDGTMWNGVIGGSAPDFTTPNEAYWSFVDAFLSYCESKGVLVFMFPAYTGFQGGSQGWMVEMSANGAAKMRTFGAWIANRYRNQKNLVWMAGGDYGQGQYPYTAAQRDVEAAMLDGMDSVASQQSIYFSAEWVRNSIATDQPDFGTRMTLNGVYANSQQINLLGQRAYSRTPVEPAFLLEEPYDQDGSDGANYNSDAKQPVRRFQWWGWLATIGGYISGNAYVWPFVSPAWQSHLDTPNTRDMTRLNALVRSVPWQDLVPSGLAGMKTLITSGNTDIYLDSYVSAAATPAGTNLVAYIGPGHSGSITVDMTAMSGTTRARWFDPTSGNYSTIAGSPFPATGTRAFTPPGANSAGQGDWVLTLDLSSVADTTAPTAPANLSATAASASQISLTWTSSSDNVGVAGYRIFRAGAQVGTAPTNVYSDSGLVSNTSYTYTVSAYDAAQNVSALSQPASATTTAPDTTPPTTPVNLAGSNITSSSVRITWAASTDNVSVAGYRVLRNGILDGTSVQPSYDDSGLSPSTSYTYTIVAYDASNNVSATSSGLNVTTAAGSSGTITFVQLKESRRTANASSINTGTFGSPVGAGHLMVVWIWYASAARTVTSVADTLGNVYVRALGPTTGTGGLAQQRQELWYAKNLAGGSTSVTATFDAAFNADTSITAHEYAGADATSPLDAASTVAVSGANVSGSPVTTTSPNELLFGATLFLGTGGPGAGFARRSSIANNVSEDKVVTTAGAYSVTFVNTSQAAIVQTATFRAASQSGSTPPGNPLLLAPRTSVLTPTLQQQFGVSGVSGASVVWAVDGIVGGNAATGTISSAGLYSPPGTAGTHTVTGTDQGQSANATVYVTTYPGSFTHHNDNFRTGQNTSETVLTPSNVGPNTFGKLFSYSLDGPAVASPLYVAGVSIPGQGLHNVAYVATEHDSVYAFDADGLSAGPLWQRSFLGAGMTPVPSNDTGDGGAIGPEIGVTGTPVIDSSTQTLYVVAKTKEGNNYVQRLHALDLGTGAEKFGGPVVIQASVPGSGAGSSLGQVAFDALHQNQRAALLLSNGVVYIAFGSHGDRQAYHGWLLGYRASTLQQVMVVNVNPNAAGAGIWQANGGPAADAAGNIYVITGNGQFDANSGGSDFGDSFLKITSSGTITDYFTPWNQGALNANDFDLGAAGPLLLPDQTGAHPHLLLSAGKNNTIYLVDRDAMGHYSGTTNDNQVVQSLVNIFPSGTPEPGNYSAPVYFNGTIYFGPVADRIQSFPLTSGRLATTAQSRSAETFPYPGATMAVSAAGATNGILWAIQRNGDCGVPATCGTSAPAVLKAYDATNLGTLLFSSDQFGERDTLDAGAKFSVPLVANGKVFVTSMGLLSVYGLLP